VSICVFGGTLYTMMSFLRISVLVALALVLLGGCSTVRPMALPERRPADFTLGVVVYGAQDVSRVEMRSARYIVDAGGNLRASVGDGSSADTYPKITRRLDAGQLDRIWSMVQRLDLDEPIVDGQVPEDGYLIEIRSRQTSRSWAGDDSAGGLVELLAGLAWIRE